MSLITLDPATAHAVRTGPTLAQSVRDAMLGLFSRSAERPATDTSAPGENDAHDVVGELIAALGHGRPIVGFDMGATVLVSGRMVEPRIWVRADGRTWTLTLLEAGTAALRIRIAAFRAADLLADAFCRAMVRAERRMDEIHAVGPRFEDGE